MWCPFCSFEETKVIDSRLNQNGDSTRRRRSCPQCNGRFTTYERVEVIFPMIIKKDGRREPYSRQKLSNGLEKACQKRAIPSQKVENIVRRIEKKLQNASVKEIPSKAIGQLLMQELHQLDKVAYVRFASVYRDFEDVQGFMQELQEEVRMTKDGAASDPETEIQLTLALLNDEEESDS